MSTIDRRSAALLASLALASCAQVSREAGFGDVERVVAERTGEHIEWYCGAADVEADALFADLLRAELSADSAVQIALLRNHELQAVYEELGIAQADVVAAGRLANPVLGAEVRFPDGGGRTALDLTLSQSFLGALYLPLRKRTAEAAFESAKLRVAGAVIDLAGRTRAAFYELQGAEQLAELFATVAEATAASAELALRLHDAGNLRDLDLANERALHEEARLDRAAAELAAIEARERLNALLGLFGAETSWRAAPRLPDPPSEEQELAGLESRAIERSLELEVARREIDRVAGTLGYSRATRVLGDGVEIGVAAERESDDGLWTIGPSASIPLPLFDQGQSAVARGEAELRALQERYAADAVAIRAEVRTTASRLVALAQRAEHLHSVLIPLRESVVAATQQQYNAMQVGAFELLAAKRREIETGARWVTALRDYWLARTELEQLLAGRRARFEPEPLARSLASGGFEDDHGGER